MKRKIHFLLKVTSVTSCELQEGISSKIHLQHAYMLFHILHDKDYEVMLNIRSTNVVLYRLYSIEL